MVNGMLSLLRYLKQKLRNKNSFWRVWGFGFAVWLFRVCIWWSGVWYHEGFVALRR